jgi:hypothetical protein
LPALASIGTDDEASGAANGADLAQIGQRAATTVSVWVAGAAAVIEEALQRLENPVAGDRDRRQMGARLDRPALDQMRKDVKTDPFDAIYFLDADRIVREVTIQTIIIEAILKPLSGCGRATGADSNGGNRGVRDGCSRCPLLQLYESIHRRRCCGR